MTFKKYGIGLVVAAALGVAGSAQGAIIVDDFNFTAGAFVEDRTVESIDNSGVVGARGTGGTVLAGWSRDKIYANLVSGDRVEQTDCLNCQEGHFIDDSNSTGNGYESWKKDSGTQDFSNTTWALDYGLDIAGLDVVLSFYDSTSSTVTGQIWWKDIAATIPPTGTPGVLSGSVGAGVIADMIFVDEISVGGIYDPSGAANYGSVLGSNDFGIAAADADWNKDNLRYTEVPEPTTLAMLGLGLAGLGWQRRRKSA